MILWRDKKAPGADRRRDPTPIYTKDKIAAWQKRMEDAFSYNDILGGRYLMRTMEIEDAVGANFVETFHGHRVLTDSFLEFFAETLQGESSFNNKNGWPQGHPYYVTCLMMFLTMYRAVRATDVLSTKGYPMQAYVIQRSLKDQVWVLCAAANNMTTFGKLFGWEGLGGENWTDDQQARVIANRQNIEHEIRERIIGKKSGLSADSQYELLRWERLFNWEAHRGLLTLFRASHQLVIAKQCNVPIGPSPDHLTASMFLNRASEVNWMILRLLTFARRKETAANDEWANKWTILDESFRYMVEGLANIGKKIAPAFIELLDAKFKFTPKTYFFEPKERS